ncbi:hypothetical protein JAAARDRAFT_204377 [Jaapia argillacea MUCL 33604]|uniref:F-box domain-containing protein n=1 Tax=Jaapia argillacea MUCL 33604 TaxID=933084 RepID=A0A067Q769_9AGAM|nr:hypothetical protein JAAARDRAFT_204377 [Jaapia argillacea MUCL 33604]
MLTHVTLVRFWFPDSLPIPWSQLTHLTLGSEDEPLCVPPYEFFETLRKCTELTHLDIVHENNGDDDDDDDYDDGEQASPQDHIVLHNLQFLRLLEVPRDDQLFLQLVVPNLVNLTYAPPNDSLGTSTPTSSLPALQKCITRSGCTITTFELGPTDTSSQDVFGCLDSLPSLRELTIDVAGHFPRFQSAIIDYFLPDGNRTSSDSVASDYKLPMLQRITIMGLKECEFVESLVSMIRFRCGFSSSTDLLARLVVAAFDKDLYAVLETRLKDCIEAGLRLDVCG